LLKAGDATTTFDQEENIGKEVQPKGALPRNHKFSANDVVVLTLQPKGSGDFFGSGSLPTNKDAVTVEARVLSTGPTYIDFALPGGAFEAAFGPAPNNYGPSGKGDPGLRLRADRFFSNIPYTRMVAALSQLTSPPDIRKKRAEALNNENKGKRDSMMFLDEVIRDVILSTYSFADPSNPLYKDPDACNLGLLVSAQEYPGTIICLGYIVALV
jgi:hypothetical protein